MVKDSINSGLGAGNSDFSAIFNRERFYVFKKICVKIYIVYCVNFNMGLKKLCDDILKAKEEIEGPAYEAVNGGPDISTSYVKDGVEYEIVLGGPPRVIDRTIYSR